MGYLLFESKMKILVWCMGETGTVFPDFMKKYGEDSIIGYTDSNKKKNGKLYIREQII